MDPTTLARLLPKLDQKIELFMRIRAWYPADRELRAARAQIDTLRGLAREFGIAENTIYAVIRRNGEYKQVSPELAAETRNKRRAQLDRLRRLHLY
jgi:transposase-like protein